MQIQIAPSNGVPIYLQIVNQVRYLVASGGLEAGEELPPIRVLAVTRDGNRLSVQETGQPKVAVAAYGSDAFSGDQGQIRHRTHRQEGARRDVQETDKPGPRRRCLVGCRAGNGPIEHD